MHSGSSRVLLRSPMPSGKAAPTYRPGQIRQRRWCSRVAKSSEYVVAASSPELRDDHSTSRILQEGHNRTRTRRRSRRRSRQSSSDVAPRTEAIGTTRGLVPAGPEAEQFVVRKSNTKVQRKSDVGFCWDLTFVTHPTFVSLAIRLLETGNESIITVRVAFVGLGCISIYQIRF